MIFGIDLGTTNTSIAFDGKTITIPSCVAFIEDQVVVGAAARNLQLLHPDKVVSSSKRRMGHDPRATEIAAHILRALKEQTGVEAAVITVPAYFDDLQRRATLVAAELAGIHVLRLLNEPTAAALAYAAPERELVLVYDLGGGTFDVSLVDVSGDLRHVQATIGDSQLGGDDFDALLVGMLAMKPSVRANRIAEQVKIALSTQDEVRIDEPFVDGTHVRATIKRSDFEAAITPLVQRTVQMCSQLLRDARVKRIDRVCLVGGSTRIPLVTRMLESALGVAVHAHASPDLAVALGAEMQAQVLTGGTIKRVLIDVATHSLGIAVADEEQDVSLEAPDTFAPIIKRNTVLPARRIEYFETAQDGQRSVQLDVFQGDEARASDNRKVGAFEFALRPAPAGTRVGVEFRYDLDGVVRIALEQGGARSEVQVRTGPAAARSDATSPIERQVAALLAHLDGSPKQRLQAAYEDWCHQRAGSEDMLLDLFLEFEDAHAAS